MSFLDIKDPAERATLFKEYVAAMETVKQRNMTNREMMLAIGGELQTLFHPIVNATKQAAEETRKELAPMKKTSTDIDGALKAQPEHVAKPPPPPRIAADTTYGFRKKDRQLWKGNKAVRIDGKGKIVTVDDTVYAPTPGLLELITNIHPRPDQYNSNDEGVYRSLVAQTRVKSFPNRTGGARPYATWKWKQFLKKMVISGERITEEDESEETDDAPYTALVGDTESSDITSPTSTRNASDVPSSSDYGIPPSPAYIRDNGEAKKTKDREPFMEVMKVVE